MKTLPLLLFLFSSTLFSQDTIESLKIHWPERYEWEILTNQGDEKMQFVELIPKTQSVDNWEILGTMISMKGATNVPVVGYIDIIFEQMKQTAPKATLTVLEKKESGKNPWALFTIESPGFIDDTTPESQIYYVIQGESSFYSNLVAVKKKKLTKAFIKEWSAVFKASEFIYRQNFDAMSQRIEEHIKLEAWEEADEQLTVLIGYFPDNSSLYFKRGYVRLKDLNYEEGIEDFTKVIALSPEKHTARTNRGYAYRMIGDYDKAIQDFNGELEINPNAYSYEHLSMVYYLKKEYARALEQVNTSIDQKPENAIAYKTRALIYKEMDLKEKACADNTQAQEMGILDKHPSFNEDIADLDAYCGEE